MSDQCKHEMKRPDCDYCRPKPPHTWRPASEIVSHFLARFDSDCDDCGARMRAGDEISRCTDGDYICGRCTDPDWALW